MAGEFTKPALEQLKNNKFSVLYIPYQDVVKAFSKVGFDIAFDETTLDSVYESANKQLSNLASTDMDIIRQALTEVSKLETDKFMTALQATLERFIIQIILIPLFGTEVKFKTVTEAVEQLNKLDQNKPEGKLHKIEVIVDYNNGDTIRASFTNDIGATDFLNKLEK